MNEVWKELGSVDPDGLGEARAQLHHAAQLLALGIGRSLLEHQADDSHTNLEWTGDRWLGGEIPGSGVRGALRPADLTLSLVHGDGEATLDLPGRTLGDAVAWLKDRLAGFGVDAGPVSMDAHYEIPDHPVARGAAFGTDLGAPLAELAAWYADAGLVLGKIAGGDSAFSSIRTWPHHFDIAMLRTLEPSSRSADGPRPTVGAGLSPGDDHDPVPYFYVNAWPSPAAADLPEAPAGGEWHTGSWVGGVLRAPRLLEAGDAGAQEARALSFLRGSMAVMEDLLAGSLPRPPQP